MNRLEFNMVLKILGVKLLETRKHPTYEEYFYEFDNLNISFCTGKYYAVVSGKIPLEVANIIYNKYPGNPHKIRVNGGCEDWDPNYWSVDKRYIGTYHIDTKEGLLIFLLEMFDYEARKKNLPENYVKLYQVFLNDISRRLIKIVRPEISNDEWMKDAKRYLDSFPDTYQMYLESKKISNEDIDKKIRRYLRKFDCAVNPFQAHNNCFDRVEDIFDYLGFYGFLYEKEDGMEKEDCAIIYLTDLATKNYVKFNRTPDGFYYTMNYTIAPGDEFIVIHYFANHYYEKFDNGEVLVLKHYKDGEYLFNVRYNITQNQFGDTYGKKGEITLEQKKWVLDELRDAVKCASSVTLNKLQTKNPNKKLILANKSTK